MEIFTAFNEFVNRRFMAERGLARSYLEQCEIRG